MRLLVLWAGLAPALSLLLGAFVGQALLRRSVARREATVREAVAAAVFRVTGCGIARLAEIDREVARALKATRS